MKFPNGTWQYLHQAADVEQMVLLLLWEEPWQLRGCEVKCAARSDYSQPFSPSSDFYLSWKTPIYLLFKMLLREAQAVGKQTSSSGNLQLDLL